MLIKTTDPSQCDPLDMDGTSGVSMRVLVGREDGAPNFALRHFTVAPGGHTPKHHHNYEHELVILAGSGEAEDRGTTHAINAGDVLYVSPNDEHQFRNTGSEPLQMLCLVPLAAPCGMQVPGS